MTEPYQDSSNGEFGGRDASEMESQTIPSRAASFLETDALVEFVRTYPLAVKYGAVLVALATVAFGARGAELLLGDSMHVVFLAAMALFYIGIAFGVSIGAAYGLWKLAADVTGGAAGT
jgi:hypothetical protein